MSKNYRETLNERLKDPEFKKAYDDLEPEFQVIQTLIDGRKEKIITPIKIDNFKHFNRDELNER